MEPFLHFLSTWAAKKILDKGLNVFYDNINIMVDSLIKSPLTEGWPGEITNEHKALLGSFKRTTPSKFGKFVASLRKSNSRSIVVLGPSGVGKTCVAMRLAGKIPNKVSTTTDNVERERFVANLKAINVISPPGYRLHGDYLDTVGKIIASPEPPKVVCIVVCGGFHATAKKDHVGTLEAPNYSRPGYREALPTNITEFRNLCFREEELYLSDLHEKVAGTLKESIPWVITIVNKRDLWLQHHDTLNRYSEPDSSYVKALNLLRGPECFGAPDSSIASHVLLPVYLTDDGFGPDPSLQATALRQAHMEADAMVLRALVFNKYARGSG